MKKPKKPKPRNVQPDLMKGEPTDEITVINGQPLTREQLEKYLKKHLLPGKTFVMSLRCKEEDESSLMARLEKLKADLESKGATVQINPDTPLDGTQSPVLFDYTPPDDVSNQITNFRLWELAEDGERLELPSTGIKDAAEFRRAMGIPEDMAIYQAGYDPARGSDTHIVINGVPIPTSPHLTDEFVENVKALSKMIDEGRIQFHYPLSPYLAEILQRAEKSVEQVPYEDDSVIESGSITRVELPPFNPTPIDWGTFVEFVPESERKKMYAYDAALALEFEWDYESPSRLEELYECLELNGWTWNGEAWVGNE